MKTSIAFALILFCVLSVLAVAAENFEVTIEPIDNVISFEQKAKFRVTIENLVPNAQVFRLKTLDFPVWELSTEPLVNPITLVVPGKGTDSIIVAVNPLRVASIGAYDVNLNIRREMQQGEPEVQNMPLRVNIATPEAGAYVETVLATIIAEEEINPNEPLSVKVKLDNQNSLEYSNLTIVLKSRLFRGEIQSALGKKEKKTVEFKSNIDALTPPGADTLVVSVLKGNKTLDTEVHHFEIVRYQDIVRSEKKEKKLLKGSTTYTYANKGNFPFDGVVKVENNLIDGLFTSSSPRGYGTKEEGVRFLALKVHIEPGEEFTWAVTSNYLSLVVIIALLLLSIALYYLYRAPVVVQKSFSNIVMREGGVSEFKVIINIKNRGKEPLHGIEVVDRVPNIGDFESGLSLGTLHPISVRKHEKKGTIVRWRIESLDPEDERVITFKMKSHLPILGQFTLSPALATFHHYEKRFIVHSNSIEVSPVANF